METRKLMAKPNRFNLLLRLAECQGQIDVLNKAAVAKYIQHTGAAHRTMPYGADQCRIMGRDMAEMEREGLFERSRIGIGNGFCYQGFPRWVWVYNLTDLGRDRLKEVLRRQPIAS